MKTTIMDGVIEKINRASLKFLEPLNPEETYKIIVEEAVKLVNADEGLMILSRGGFLETVYGSTPVAEAIQVRKRGFAYRAFKQRKAFVIHGDQVAEADPKSAKLGVQSILFIPLSYRHTSIGVLAVRSYKKGDELSDRELKILQLFGSFASLGVRKTELYDETRKALETRDLFISMAAHELRTPLTAVSGYAQLLYTKFSKSESSEGRWSEHLYGETVRLANLINELLEINRIKNGKLEYRWKECSIRDIVSRAQDTFNFTYDYRQLVIEDKIEDKSDKVVGDYDKLLQAVLNLLENAVKFSANSDVITIRIEATGTHIHIKVKDQGQGIPKSDLPKVFEGFYRGNTTQTEGMGLGLFLVKDIITRHRGTIKINSRVKKGTTVELALPQL